jgi:hypothetical protein
LKERTPKTDKALARESIQDENTLIQEPPSDFGIRLMDVEEVILSIRPYGLV